MRISTTTRYSLMALLDIIHYGKGEPVSVAKIAQRQHIPVNFLEQLFLLLRKSGLVKSIMGARGGFIIKGNIKTITVADVIKAVEGHVAPIYRTKTRSKLKPPKDKKVLNTTENLWKDLGALIIKFFKGYSLDKLARLIKTTR